MESSDLPALFSMIRLKAQQCREAIEAELAEPPTEMDQTLGPSLRSDLPSIFDQIQLEIKDLSQAINEIGAAVARSAPKTTQEARWKKFMECVDRLIGLNRAQRTYPRGTVDADGRRLLLSVMASPLSDIRDWAQTVVEQLTKLEEEGLEGMTHLTFSLKLNAAPELNGLLAWVQDQTGSPSGKLAPKSGTGCGLILVSLLGSLAGLILMI